MDLELGSSTKGLLAPGFRFHPTDEELVRYYLRRKICGKPFRFDAISDIDIYKVEPWDLPGKSRLKTRDLEWYFFSVLDKKYGNGSKTNRATDRGYWKTTGKDRTVYHRSRIVGMKKTLVYHSGRAPRGERTNWVMHEYRLIDEELERAGFSQDAFVLCRIFRKSGPGPKNGEKYGAPLIEEEWEDDELIMVPKDEYSGELPLSDDGDPDAYLDENDLEQILTSSSPLHDAPVPLNFSYGDNNQNVDGSSDFIDNTQEFLVGVDELNDTQEQTDGKTLFNLPVQYDIDAKSVKREYIGEPSYTSESSNAENPVEADYLLNESFFDAVDNPQYGNGSFIETNDLQNPVEADPSSFDMLDEYLQYFDATDDNLQNLGFDYPNMAESEDVPSDLALFLPYKDVKEDINHLTMTSEQLLEGYTNEVSSSSKQEKTKLESDFQYPFIKQASRMMGNISAPPAFASEFPMNGTALHLNSASSSSVHVTAGMIQIRNVNLSGTGMDWSFGKNGNVNIILSFGLTDADDDNYSADSEPMSNAVLSSKADSAMNRGWLYFMFIWVLILSMSFKIGTYIYAN